jgi:hypothetical protein
VIDAYPLETTVDAGASVVLRVSTDAPRFRVGFFRQAARYEPAGNATDWLRGTSAWAAYEFKIPRTWSSGAYIAHVVAEGQPHPFCSDARSGRAVFVVRTGERARLLVNLPLFTYHAYNLGRTREGGCLYNGKRHVTLHRPGGGNGGYLWDQDNVDEYDRASPRQTFAHWDAPALAWLYGRGHTPAVCTDLDLHERAVPDDVQALLFFGHQEYWTRRMREHVEEFVRRGGNAAFFCGNTAWFRVRYDARRHAIVRDGKWSDDEPEEGLTGTSYRFGGGRWRGARPPSGYTVARPLHWAFAGTGLTRGTTFGADMRLVGYECDGCNPQACLSPIATSTLDGWTVNDGGGEVLGGNASMLSFRRGKGQVFNAATVDWARGLARAEPVVEQITRNVVDRFLNASSRPDTPRKVPIPGFP